MSVDFQASLLHFLQLFHDDLAKASFQYPRPHPVSLAQLRDGTFLYHYLHTLDPQHFDLDSLLTGASLSVEECESNLQSLLISLETFLEESQTSKRSLDLSSFIDSDIAANTGGDSKNDRELVKLVQCVIVCAIHTSRRETVIDHVMTMTESEQAHLMTAINDTMTKLGLSSGGNGEDLGSPRSAKSLGGSSRLSSSSDVSPASNSLTASLTSPITSTINTAASAQSLQSRLTAIERDYRDLQHKHTALIDAHSSTAADRDRETRRLIKESIETKEREYNDRLKNETAKSTREIRELEHKLNELHSTLTKHQQSELLLNKEKNSLTASIEELKAREIELKDRLQVAAVKADQATQLEAKLARLQSRLDSVGDMQIAFDLQEEQARKDIEKILSLESQLKDFQSLKASHSKYKDSIVQLQQEVMEAKIRDENLSSELAELTTEKKQHLAEINNLRLEIETMKQNDNERRVASGNESLSNSLTESRESMLVEKVRRLESELASLRSATGASAATGASHSEHSDELEIAQRLQRDYQNKYVEAQRKIAQLESRLRKEAEPSPTSNLSSSLPSTAAALPSVSASSASSDSSAIRMKKLEHFIKHQQRKIKSYQSTLNEQVRDLTLVNEQNRLLRAQLIERERELEVKEKLRLDDLTVSMRERKLLSSAFYSLGLEYSMAVNNGKASRLNQSAAWINQQRKKMDPM